jgi:hypothetical protein
MPRVTGKWRIRLWLGYINPDIIEHQCRQPDHCIEGTAGKTGKEKEDLIHLTDTLVQVME